MSYYVDACIDCDARLNANCHECIGFTQDKKRVAYREAKSKGWVCKKGRDICPACAEKRDAARD